MAAASTTTTSSLHASTAPNANGMNASRAISSPAIARSMRSEYSPAACILPSMNIIDLLSSPRAGRDEPLAPDHSRWIIDAHEMSQTAAQTGRDSFKGRRHARRTGMAIVCIRRDHIHPTLSYQSPGGLFHRRPEISHETRGRDLQTRSAGQPPSKSLSVLQ